MTNEQFLEKVKNRANERVQRKLRVFKDKICDAFRELTDDGSLLSKEAQGQQNYSNDNRMMNVKILENMLNRCTLMPSNGWPEQLWRKEELAVQEEIFNQMDAMQKALLSQPPKDTDYKPAE